MLVEVVRGVNGEAANGEGVEVNGESVNAVNGEVRGIKKIVEIGLEHLARQKIPTALRVM